MKKVICFTDGVARGNPGPAGVGVYITDEPGTLLREVGQAIGNSGSNYAEYHAVLLGLETLKDLLGAETTTTLVEVCLASETTKRQLNAEDQIKEPGLVPLFVAIHNFRVSDFPNITYTFVPRTLNQEAERLAGGALDGK